MRMTLVAVVLTACGTGAATDGVGNNGLDVEEATLTYTVLPAGAGTITVSPKKTTYHVGDAVKLTAKAAAGYTLQGWSGDIAASTAPTVSFALAGDTDVQATFTRGTGSVMLEIINDLPGTVEGSDDWSQMNTLIRMRAGSTLAGVRDAGEGELLTDGTSSCTPGSISVGSRRSFDVSALAPNYFIYVQTGAWEYDPFFGGCWDLYLTEVYGCGGSCCTAKSATKQISGHTSGTKTVRLSELLPPKTWQGSSLCQ